MNNFTIALLQLLPEATIEENLQKGLKACEQAKAFGADLALFPEMWSIGYQKELMTMEHAVGMNHHFIQQFCAKAKELEMAIAITYLGKGDVLPTNSVAVIDATGTIILEYAKLHICSFDFEAFLEAGKSFKVADLKFKHGSVRIGAMICFDREFPESARTLMMQGAEIIIVPNSCPMQNDESLGDVRLAQLRGRAFENMVGIALTNYPAPKDDGRSCAFDVDGKFLVISENKEDVVLATFDLEKIKNWQRNEFWGAKLRRPECYL